MSDSPPSTNIAGSKEEFNRTYENYNPAPSQGPVTEILATVLNPQSGGD